MDSTPRSHYKLYFKNTGGITKVPNRTRYRRLKRMMLFDDSCEAQENIVGPPQQPSDIEEEEDANFSSANESDDDIENNSIIPTEEPMEFCQSTSESESDSEEEPESKSQGTSPLLFPGARIRKMESLLLIYAFTLRHKLSKSAISDLLTLVNFHLPVDVKIPSSVYLLEKALSPDFSLATKIFYCAKCEVTVDNGNAFCTNCQNDVADTESLEKKNFFMIFNLKLCLENVLRNKTLANALGHSLIERNRNENVSETVKDIKDGVMYKQLGLGPSDFSCSTCTDGVSIFKSSKISIWPILVSINELPYKIRRQNTILAGMWIGKKKPSFETFLSPFIAQCNDLLKSKVEWSYNGKTMHSRVMFPIVAADSVARCALQGIKQYNGEYGCNYCVASGRNHSDEAGRVWIFPPGTSDRRTASQFKEHLRILQGQLERGESNNYYGVMTASPFLLLKNFDIVNGFVFDILHTCFLGVVKMFTSRWLDSTYHAEQFYIGRRLKDLNKKFTRFKIPNECNRIPRDLGEYHFFKGNEWKTWMLVCIPVLKGILRDTFVNHFAKFVNAVFLLNSTSVSLENINTAKVLLNEFCEIAPNLYGDRICTYNMHLLLHVSDCVKQWGPLYSYSLFQYEHTNGVLRNYFCGTNQVCMQIIRKTIMVRQVACFGELHFNNTITNSFFNSLLYNRRFSSKIIRNGDIVHVRPKKEYSLNDREIRKLSQVGIINITSAHSFKSCFIKARKFCASKHDSKNYVNSIVRINGKLYILVNLLLLEADNESISAIFVKQLTISKVGSVNSAYKVTNISHSLKAFHMYQIEDFKFIVSYDNTGNPDYISEMNNMIELE